MFERERRSGVAGRGAWRDGPPLTFCLTVGTGVPSCWEGSANGACGCAWQQGRRPRKAPPARPDQSTEPASVPFPQVRRGRSRGTRYHIWCVDLRQAAMRTIVTLTPPFLSRALPLPLGPPKPLARRRSVRPRRWRSSSGRCRWGMCIKHGVRAEGGACSGGPGGTVMRSGLEN